MRHRRLAVLGLLGGLLCAIGLGAAVGLLAAAQSAAARTTVNPIFPSIQLMPGQHVTGQFVVSPGSHGFVPWLRVENLKQGCATNTACASLASPLSSELHVQVSAPNGSTLQTTITDLVAGKALPGGLLSPGDPARHYRAVLSMPAGLDDAYQDRTISFGTQFGPRIAVRAQHGHRGQSHGDGNQTGEVGVSNQGGSLPFTGADIAVELAAALSAIAIGVMLVGSVRRRHG
jgi:hypothetical protein